MLSKSNRRSLRRRPKRANRTTRSGATKPEQLWKLTSINISRSLPALRQWMRGDSQYVSVLNGQSLYNVDSFAFTGVGNLAASAQTMVEASQDYRFLAIKVLVVPLGDYTGFSSFTFADDTSQSASSAYANSTVTRIQNTNKQPPRSLVWKNSSLYDLGFSSSGGNFPATICNFLIYSATNAVNGTGATINYFRLEFQILCEYRGIGS